MSNPLSGAPLGPSGVDGKTIDARTAAFIAANACESKLAQSTVVLDVASVTVLAEYFVFAGGESAAQVKAIANAVDQALGAHDFKRKSIEGMSEARWVLLDYGSVIVHVLQEKERSFYKIEQFWNHALIVDRQEWVEE
ncbi:MAG: ribosome silencing factor [Candidatus Melainabacteria bacterium]|nr:ribosome silencing factor [Candidatus Melainabacteria bacterium]